MPVFFIALLSETMGWIPTPDQVPLSMAEHYGWVEGVSMLEMEIMHAAYRSNNPNGTWGVELLLAFICDLF